MDRALITYFKSPQSFTGEDVVELSCHGSPVLLLEIVDVLLHLGARVADPGEFTLRALANKRLNLSQAEAIRDLIDAQTTAGVKQAARQLGGELSARLQPVKETLLSIIVPLESALEFVEDDLPRVAVRQILAQLSVLIEQLEQLASTFRAGRLLKEGLRVALAGRPNVGKSSLFNSLLARDRALVTSFPGTTRDSLSELVNIKGVPVLLTDTAGVRDSPDEIERLGIERTRRAIAEADLVVVVLDGTTPVSAEDAEVLAEVGDSRHIIVLNKCDLDSFSSERANLQDNGRPPLAISATKAIGLDSLRAAILQPFATRETPETDFLITNARHFDLLRRSVAALRSTIDLFHHRASEELLLVGLYEALNFLGGITGETTPEDVLTRIFATFCIGK